MLRLAVCWNCVSMHLRRSYLFNCTTTVDCTIFGSLLTKNKVAVLPNLFNIVLYVIRCPCLCLVTKRKYCIPQLCFMRSCNVTLTHCLVWWTLQELDGHASNGVWNNLGRTDAGFDKAYVCNGFPVLVICCWQPEVLQVADWQSVDEQLGHMKPYWICLLVRQVFTAPLYQRKLFDRSNRWGSLWAL